MSKVETWQSNIVGGKVNTNACKIWRPNLSAPERRLSLLAVQARPWPQKPQQQLSQ